MLRSLAVPRWQRVYMAACCGLIGSCLAYVLCDFGAWPRLTYFPYERSWHLVEGPPGAIPMAYVGTILWGLGGGLAGITLGLIVISKIPRPLSDRALRLAGAWALAAFAYAGLYYTWNLWPF